MKRYIKSDYSPEMCNRVRSQNPNGYLYIFKHGVGPGTIPHDVEVLKYKDLPNYYTAVWLDRFLTTSELREYDIPSETRINTILDRIGYCQKNGDVVPCDGVEACDKVTASEICYRDRDNDDRVVALDVGMSEDEVEEMLAAHPSYYRSTLDIEACDNITSSAYDYTQLALPDYKYSVEGYYDSNFQGLVDSYSGNDFSEALDAAHEFASNGDFIIIKNVQTGRTRSYSTDDWFNAIDTGDYPADVYNIH